MSTAPGVEIQKIEGKLATLRRQADELIVVDTQGYILACQIALAGRAEIKAIGFALDPGITSASEHLDKLRRDKQKYVDRYKPIVEIVTKKGEQWKAEERRNAKEEQDGINEKARVAARKTHTKTPPPVEVQPSVPKVAGIRARVNWHFLIVDSQKIPRAYLMPDAGKIGVMVRATKDKAKAEAECPGIEVYSEDSI